MRPSGRVQRAGRLLPPFPRFLRLRDARARRAACVPSPPTTSPLARGARRGARARRREDPDAKLSTRVQTGAAMDPMPSMPDAMGGTTARSSG